MSQLFPALGHPLEVSEPIYVPMTRTYTHTHTKHTHTHTPPQRELRVHRWLLNRMRVLHLCFGSTPAGEYLLVEGGLRVCKCFFKGRISELPGCISVRTRRRFPRQLISAGLPPPLPTWSSRARRRSVRVERVGPRKWRSFDVPLKQPRKSCTR